MGAQEQGDDGGASIFAFGIDGEMLRRAQGLGGCPRALRHGGTHAHSERDSRCYAREACIPVHTHTQTNVHTHTCRGGQRCILQALFSSSVMYSNSVFPPHHKKVFGSGVSTQTFNRERQQFGAKSKVVLFCYILQ